MLRLEFRLALFSSSRVIPQAVATSLGSEFGMWVRSTVFDVSNVFAPNQYFLTIAFDVDFWSGNALSFIPKCVSLELVPLFGQCFHDVCDALLNPWI